MSALKPVTLLTSQYLRKMGLTQALPIGTCYTHHCFNCNTQRPIYPDKVRLGFIPDNWFTYFYSKTGITGPYVFGLGLLNYLFSKEIYVCEHQFYSGISFGIMWIAGVKKFGPKVANYCDKEIEKIENQWKKDHEDEVKALQELIDQEEFEQWRAEGNLMLMQLKKENINLQLEAAYRQALSKVYEDVKRRLDYMVACHNVEKRINQKHMMAWLVKEVTEQLPKDINSKQVKKYKEDLSAMTLQLNR